MKSRNLFSVFIVYACLCFSLFADEQFDVFVNLTLHKHGDETELEIRTTNASDRTIELISAGSAPPWPVSEWFQWKVNAEPAMYYQNVAGLLSIRETKHIEPGETILWGKVNILSLCIGEAAEWPVKNGSRYPRKIDLEKNNTIMVVPSKARWGNIRIKPAQIEMRAR